MSKETIPITPKIEILLSTYNGERYLVELLESIFNQSFKDWQLLIRDDGSTDKTSIILDDYCKKYPSKITLMTQEGGNLGPMLSFGKLIEFSTAPYVMFCDQDDVWLKDKIELTFNRMQELENKFSKDKPLLVFTDSSLTDERLNITASSSHQHVGLNKQGILEFRNLILRNPIFGNTMMMNRSLVKISCPIPKDAFMHDWWVGIMASALGHIDYLSKATVLYRQHGRNVCGLGKKDHRKYYQHQDGVMKQIKVLYERFGMLSGNVVVPKNVLEISPLANLGQLSYWKRKSFLLSFYKKCIYREKAIVDLLFYFKIYR